MYAGVPLNNVMYDLVEKDDGSYDGSAWFAVKPDLMVANPLINLPYVLDGEKVVSQSNACLAYLARRLGLWGRTLEEKCDCEQLLCELMDLRNTMTDFCYASRTFDSAAATALIRSVQGRNNVLQKLELWLEKKANNHNNHSGNHSEIDENPHMNGTFLVGNRATAPDFHLYELLVQYGEMAEFLGLPPFLSAFPRLDHFKRSFEALPGNARYLNSKIGALKSLPFNNKMACFGADVNGGVWVKGTSYDFNTYTGIF